MRIDYPLPEQESQLRKLWKEAFGDSDAFLDGFFTDIFAPDRCRCVSIGDHIAAALYWFDCRANDKPMAYLYAIAAAKAFRHQGICRAMMENTHDLLRSLGYAGCLLVPGEPGLVTMYEKMDYRVCSSIREFSCKPADLPVPLRPLSPAEYAAARRELLPQGSVIQEGENMDFLAKMARFYAGEDCIFCAIVEDGKLFCPEILGNADAAPEILAALSAAGGTFRTPGPGKAFAMYHPLSDAPAPAYFGLAFD